MTPLIACRRAGKRTAAPFGDKQQQPDVQQQTAAPAALANKQPIAADSRHPNIQYHAYNIHHTQQAYANRYHPFLHQLQHGNRQEAAVLQPIQDMQRLEFSTLPGLAILLREHPQLSSKLVWHPCGTQVLDAEAMQTVPQNGRTWHRSGMDA